MRGQFIQNIVLPGLVFPSSFAKKGGESKWSGKPIDWSDIRKDCPANSIALYAGVKADYSQYDNLGFTATMSASDLTIVGSPTINNGIASGFSTSDYIETAQSFNITDIFHIHVTVDNFSASGSSQFIFGLLGENYAFGLYFGNTATGISGIFGGSNYWTGLASGLNVGAPLNIDFSGNGTDFTCTITQGSYTKTSTKAIADSDMTGNYYLRLGFRQSSQAFSTGSIDLNNTYVKVNEEYFLAPYNANGYKVYIDETLYGTYNSSAQCSITWSEYTATAGEAITTPSDLTAHKIWIEPATDGNNITQLICQRVATEGTEQQGILWIHFNLSNKIKIASMVSSNNYRNAQLLAITAKNNKIFIDTNANSAFLYCSNLEYLPTLYGDGVSNYDLGAIFDTCSKIKRVSLSAIKITSSSFMFNYCDNLENIKYNNVVVNLNANSLNNMYRSCYKLKNLLPSIYNANITQATNYITNASNLQNIIIDARAAINLTRIGTYGTSTYFMDGLKGLRVSNEAPFNNATSPQIDVSYTGLDRAALVQLFNDLPGVSSGQIINITGCTGSEDLTAADIAIAENKGWTITK